MAGIVCVVSTMKLAVLFAVAALGAVHEGKGAKNSTTYNRHRRSGSELFLSIVGERPSSKSNINTPILPVQLPIQLGGHGGVTLPILVLPVPVFTKSESCSAHHQEAEKPLDLTPASRGPPYVAIRQPFTEVKTASQPDLQPQLVHQNLQPEHQQLPQQPQLPTYSQLPQQPQPSAHHQLPQQPQLLVHHQLPQQPQLPKQHQLPELHQRPEKLEQSQPEQHSHQPVKTPLVSAPVIHIPDSHGKLNVNLGTMVHKVNYKVNVESNNTPDVVVVPSEDDDVREETAPSAADESVPFSEGPQIFETSEQMIQSFRRQAPVAPELPAVIPGLNLPDRLPVTESSSGVHAPPIAAPAPPRPDFNRSLRLRVDLTVPSSDYTEAYDIQWHAESNTAKTVIEDGSTVTYRAPLADGRVQFLEVQVDRSNGSEVRRCTLSPLMAAKPADHAFPGLPEVDQFQFAGYTTAEGQSLVERWRRVVTGGPGENGAVEGESLTITHELLIIRDRGLAVPLRYTVITDSSVLGPASDSYTHRYNLLAPPTSAVLPDTAQECDLFDEIQEESGQERQRRDVKGFLSKVVSRFDPIREFAGATRDTKYESILDTFKTQFKRKYLDPAEEALRKNLLIKSTRFIDAGNRLASGFKMAANFMADRLDDEITQLFGVQAPPEGATEAGMIPFPYTEKEVEEVSSTLSDEFDWRPLGAVSPVRFQETTCASCWAFAVAGSTEGALFKKTNKLVPLSPQCLVDCGKPFGTNGCNGTWPSFAYDYVQARGLPAWDEYTNYQAKVLECKDKSVPPVTHISGHVNVTANSEAALKLAIKNHAPNVVIVDAKASSFIYYKSGVLKDKRCGQNKPKLNHAVLAVGWGTKDGPHFIIKNTWSAKWGEEGYIRIAPDSCAVMERPSYALIEKPNIDREDLRSAAANVKED